MFLNSYVGRNKTITNTEMWMNENRDVYEGFISAVISRFESQSRKIDKNIFEMKFLCGI